jgi:transcriptional regulator with XRE-family HTH domain
MDFTSDHFSRAFGDSLQTFLNLKGITYAEAARRLGVERATLPTYWTDDSNGKRRKARVELLYRACIELGFEFEYNGYNIAARSLIKPEGQGQPRPSEQLHLDFSRQFKLTEDDGEVSVKLSRRQPGRFQLSVSLEAVS